MTSTFPRCFTVFFFLLFTAWHSNATAAISATINHPSAGDLTILPVNISGTVEATQGVADVLIGIRDESSKLWWQADGWGDWILHRAEISTSSDGTQASWRYMFRPGSSAGSGQYRIYVRARDTSNTLSESSQQSFLGDAGQGVYLNAEITTPSTGEALSLPASLGGTASSPFGVENVLVGIKDVVRQQWWNGNGWGDWVLNSAVLTPTSNNEVNWRYHFAPGTQSGSKQYRVYVRARETTRRLSESTQAAFQAAGTSVLDPSGCDSLTNAELRAFGYEPVRAHGAVGDGENDDTAAIKRAITAANTQRRVVYMHPGNYLVSDTLEFIQDKYETRGNNNDARYGQMLLGSYCGSEQPVITLASGVANTVNPNEPFPVVLFWRDKDGALGPDDTHGGRDWNQVIRNIRIVLGDNPGAVGIRHLGAEGSSAQEVTIDANGGFAGFYNLNSSGGYTYNVKVSGGRYGIYQDHSRGGSTLVVGLSLSGQTDTPIMIDGYTPLGFVGFDIRHHDGKVIRSIRNAAGKLQGWDDTTGNIYLVDGRIEITGDGSDPVLANTNRSVYLKNVFSKGRQMIIQHDAPGGSLRSAAKADWQRITEYAYSGPYQQLYGESGMLIDGLKSDGVYFNGSTRAAGSHIEVANGINPSDDLQERHLYEVALCNVEAADNVFVTDFGANPNDNRDDTAAIQAAIEAAKSGSNRVFLPASRANAATGVLNGAYTISGALRLGNNTRLCGVSRYASVLNARDWSPTVDSAVIQTTNTANAVTKIADFKIEIPKASGYQANGDAPRYNPHVYGINWRAGQRSLYRDVYVKREWGDYGEGKAIVIRGNGGGKWFGITLNGSFLPGEYTFRDAAGNLKLGPTARNLLVTGTSQPLNFYPFHCQHMTQPGGALCEIDNAANVTVFGIKSEIGSLPEHTEALINNPANSGLIPVWMRISNSRNISLIGHEGLGQTAAGQGLIEISNSNNVTIASMGRRGKGLIAESTALPLNQWNFIRDDNTTGASQLTAQGFISLYKR